MDEVIEEWIKVLALVVFYLLANLFAVITLPLWLIPYGVWFHLDEQKRKRQK